MYWTISNYSTFNDICHCVSLIRSDKISSFCTCSSVSLLFSLEFPRSHPQPTFLVTCVHTLGEFLLWILIPQSDSVNPKAKKFAGQKTDQRVVFGTRLKCCTECCTLIMRINVCHLFSKPLSCY